MNFEKISETGYIAPRFGHTTTILNNSEIVMFGGAVGDIQTFQMTNHTYVFKIKTNKWQKLEAIGLIPEPRAAHAAVSTQMSVMMLFGGATQQQGLASNQLYKLKLSQNKGNWDIVHIVGKRPQKRYGHIMSYAQNSLVIFGGSVGNHSASDCWILDLSNNAHYQWVQIQYFEKIPQSRSYHSATMCKFSAQNQSVVIYGGRSSDGFVLNDSWYLSKDQMGQWSWNKIAFKQQPTARYQHSILIIGTVMLIIGGRANPIEQKLLLQAYDMETYKFFKFDVLQFYRNSSWLIGTNLFSCSGIQIGQQITSTNSLCKIDLMQLFAQNIVLQDKIALFEVSSPSKMHKQLEQQIGQDFFVPLDQPNYLKMEQKQKDHYIAKLFLDAYCRPQLQHNVNLMTFKFKPSLIICLIQAALKIIMQQPILLEVRTPVKIFGDIHGQLTDLLNFFKIYGSPYLSSPQKGDIQYFDYLFLGDYVDRGSYSLETMCLLLALKVLYPKSVHLIRGNHEDFSVNRIFGFLQQCDEKCQQNSNSSESVYTLMNQLFTYLSLAAIVENKIFCVHGGIGSSVQKLDDIRCIKKPVEISHDENTFSWEQQKVMDLLWSDPTQFEHQQGFIPNLSRNPTYSGKISKFGPDIVEAFLKQNDLEMIIRAHECVKGGIQRFANQKLITVFSATNYCNVHQNKGAMLLVKTSLEIITKAISPFSDNSQRWREKQEELRKRPPTPPRRETNSSK